jgi:hypothetical protein
MTSVLGACLLLGVADPPREEFTYGFTTGMLLGVGWHAR